MDAAGRGGNSLAPELRGFAPGAPTTSIARGSSECGKGARGVERERTMKSLDAICVVIVAAFLGVIVIFPLTMVLATLSWRGLMDPEILVIARESFVQASLSTFLSSLFGL